MSGALEPRDETWDPRSTSGKHSNEKLTVRVASGKVMNELSKLDGPSYEAPSSVHQCEENSSNVGKEGSLIPNFNNREAAVFEAN